MDAVGAPSASRKLGGLSARYARLEFTNIATDGGLARLGQGSQTVFRTRTRRQEFTADECHRI